MGHGGARRGPNHVTLYHATAERNAVKRAHESSGLAKVRNQRE